MDLPFGDAARRMRQPAVAAIACAAALSAAGCGTMAASVVDVDPGLFRGVRYDLSAIGGVDRVHEPPRNDFETLYFTGCLGPPAVVATALRLADLPLSFAADLAVAGTSRRDRAPSNGERRDAHDADD
jgi:hypothetical protein